MAAFFALARRHQPGIKFLLTVSPVPLTATASGAHVLAATTYSKSVLRAAAGQLAHDQADVDYFPAYEIIAGAQPRGRYFEPDLPTVSAEGVAAVMDAFFAAHKWSPAARDLAQAADDDVICDDILLEAFGR